VAESAGDPQVEQNLAVAEISAPQEEQNIRGEILHQTISAIVWR